MTNGTNKIELQREEKSLGDTDHKLVRYTRERLFRQRQRNLLVQARQRFTAQQESMSFQYCPKCGEDLTQYR